MDLVVSKGPNEEIGKETVHISFTLYCEKIWKDEPTSSEVSLPLARPSVAKSSN